MPRPKLTRALASAAASRAEATIRPENTGRHDVSIAHRLRRSARCRSSSLLLGGLAAERRTASIARVNGKTITEADMKLAEAEIGSDLGSLPEPTKRRVLVEFLIENQLFADAAEGQKLGDGRRVQRAHAVLAPARAARRLFRQHLKAAISEAEARKLYEGRSGQPNPRRRCSARHILVDSKDKARRSTRSSRTAADFRAARQGEFERPGLEGTGRRARLLRAGRWCRSSRRPPSS